MKLYKKLNKGCGGATLYFDKFLRQYLGAKVGDELELELLPNGEILLKKSILNVSKVQELLDACRK